MKNPAPRKVAAKPPLLFGLSAQTLPQRHSGIGGSRHSFPVRCGVQELCLRLQDV